MAQRRGLCLVLALALLGEAFGVPLEITRLRRGYADNELDSKEKDNKPDLEPVASESRPVRQENSFDNGDSFQKEDDTRPSESGTTTSRTELASPLADDDSDDDDDDDDFNSPPAPSGGGTGSNIFSLLRLATSIFPSSSGANSFMRNILQRYLNNQFSQPFGTSPYFTTEFNPTLFLRRQDINENLVNIDKIQGLKPPPFQRQETEEDDVDSESEQSDENDASEESDEANNGDSNGNNNNSKDESTPKSGSKESTENNGDDNDSDYSDEPPEGDGQGGGILGILASLSGGEDGQSDLGSLLATISGIVANLSGDGFDLNALIASGIGLFVGLLSEGEENPGAVIASYLLTSLDTITGGGSKNNGAFFGTFLSKLIKGTSAGGDPDASSEENGKEPEKDSAGFFASFLMALLGEMSKGSFGSSSSSSSHPTAAEQQWR